MKLAIALLFAIAVAPAFARIGETEQEIEARYGKSVGNLSRAGELPTNAYRTAGMNVIVTYINGKSQTEMFIKQDKAPLSHEEMQILLQANSDGKKWIEQAAPPISGAHIWKLESSDRIAQYHPHGSALVIFTESGAKVEEAARAKADAEKLSGF